MVMKVFNGERKALAAFDKENEHLAKSARKAEFYSGLMMPLMMFVGNLSYVAVCIVGAALAVNGKVTIGGIQAFLQYVRNFTQPIMQLAGLSSQLQRMAAASERVFEFLSENEEQEMELNEETSNISQGQKQLLTIARAILADPKVLILDEATSSVDTRTEILIQKAMDQLMEGRTSFINLKSRE
ncbi:hypothetical protein J40TS1_16870 [Paenibacillus montaniterrae]|uniref:ABC transmembrane type-1 domain-containing protein n=1 Tax=Paenibacillus montaniterrae TaxID=429341 RepID=A0A919YMN5_9BACL|nr:hypothetical protein J40TS1_16870 [Paenibacillus montaniterrae]